MTKWYVVLKCGGHGNRGVYIVVVVVAMVTGVHLNPGYNCTQSNRVPHCRRRETCRLLANHGQSKLDVYRD